MTHRRILVWFSCGLIPLATVWIMVLTAPRDQRPERATARAVAAQLDGFVGEQTAAVLELAERFSEWETLPESAVLDALRAVGTRHLALRRLLVADAAGRLIAGFDTTRPPGRESLSPGTLDRELGHREALRSGSRVLVLSRARAGVLERLELAAPIRRADGSYHGYVGATVSLEEPRRRLRDQASSGLSIQVVDRAGDRLFPCRIVGSGRGPTVDSRRFRITVRPRSRSGRWPAVLASGVVLLALLLGVALFRVLDRRR
ncbi:MAG: hypothetical protein ABI333_03580 [bacterium]